MIFFRELNNTGVFGEVITNMEDKNMKDVRKYLSLGSQLVLVVVLVLAIVLIGPVSAAFGDYLTTFNPKNATTELTTPEQTAGIPAITEFAQESPVNESTGVSRTFSTTVNQDVKVSVKVTWNINRPDEFSNPSITGSSTPLGTLIVNTTVTNTDGTVSIGSEAIPIQSPIVSADKIKDSPHENSWVVPYESDNLSG